MSKRARSCVSIVSAGVIVANLMVSSCSTFASLAPLSTDSTWLCLAAVVCGFALGIALGGALEVLCGILLMALIAVTIFGGLLVSSGVVTNVPFGILLLFALQMSFPMFISVFVFGCVGTFFAALLGPLSGLLG